MMEQHNISFTSDEEMDKSHFINYGFSPSFSPPSSPKRNQSTHSQDEDHEIPIDGMCFSSLTFDWGVGVTEETEPAVAHFNRRSTDIQSLLPSNDACAPVTSSSPLETKQRLKMQRNYASLYFVQAHASKAPHDFLSVQQITRSCSDDNERLPCRNSTVTDPTLNTPENKTAEFYSQMLQAAADRVVEQQQLSACVYDAAPSDTEVVAELSSANVVPPASQRSRLACGPPEFELFYDHQPDEEVQSIESGSQLKEDAPQFNPYDPDVFTNSVESNMVRDLLHDQDHHPTRLSIPSDEQFLDPVYYMLRSSILEVFVCGKEDNASGSVGRGRGPKQDGQIGIRCAFCKDIPKKRRANQAVSYPSKTAHIFESVRNYQRIHLEACEYIPTELKTKHRELMSNKSTKKVNLKLIKVYFAEAACEIGMVETPNGLFFGAPPNTSGKPSEKLRAIMSIAKNPSLFKDRQLQDLIFPKVDKRLENSKFSHIASVKTRQVIDNCRKENAAFVYPSDFATLSDFRFVLYHQFAPCRPTPAALSRRKIKPAKLNTLSGLCCKHCARAHPGEHGGMYFPLDFESLHDSSFFNNLTCHMATCRFVPLETKEVLEELQDLAAEHGVITKRGAKRMFLKKLWERMSNYYPAP